MSLCIEMALVDAIFAYSIDGYQDNPHKVCHRLNCGSWKESKMEMLSLVNENESKNRFSWN